MREKKTLEPQFWFGSSNSRPVFQSEDSASPHRYLRISRLSRCQVFVGIVRCFLPASRNCEQPIRCGLGPPDIPNVSPFVGNIRFQTGVCVFECVLKLGRVSDGENACGTRDGSHQRLGIEDKPSPQWALPPSTPIVLPLCTSSCHCL